MIHSGFHHNLHEQRWWKHCQNRSHRYLDQHFEDLEEVLNFKDLMVEFMVEVLVD